MKCPTCPDTSLVMTDRQGVEIDYCPSCRGIWLDRAAAAIAPAAPASAPLARNRQQPDFEDSHYHSGQSYQRGRKKSWLSDIFD
jgi:hypothetical protein